MSFKSIVLIILSVFSTAVFMTNNEPVDINLLFGDVTMAKNLLLVLFLVIGIIIGFIIARLIYQKKKVDTSIQNPTMKPLTPEDQGYIS